MILGSTKEAEEFDHLSPEESKKRLAILLKKMDLNGDSHIERHELKAWILRSFKYVCIIRYLLSRYVSLCCINHFKDNFF